MSDELEEWYKAAQRGTRGDMVFDILKDWQEERDRAGSPKITQRQLETILINEGVIQAAAIEDPEGYDGGKTELAMTIATQQINECLAKPR